MQRQGFEHRDYPKEFDTLMNYAALLGEVKHDFDRAAELFRRVLKLLPPDHPDALNAQGNLDLLARHR